MTQPPSDKLVGKRVGAYRIEELLGAGGLGAVVLARGDDGAPVAIKLLTNLSARSKARFQRELELGMSLVHPHLVQTLGGGTEGDVPYLVLEYLEGTNLGAALGQGGAATPARLVEIAAQVGAGLDYLHGQGLVHRDLKPDNIQVLPDGSMKILDLGMLRAPERTRLTATGTVLGTFLYMSPEQIRGRPATAAADLYALGMVLYRALTLRNPFFATRDISLAGYLPLLERSQPMPWDPARPPAALQRFFERALALRLRERPPDGASLARALRAALREDGLLPPSPEEPASSSVTLDLSTTSRSDGGGSTDELAAIPPSGVSAAAPSPRLPPGRRRALALTVGALGLAAAGLALRPGAPPRLLSVHALALSDRHRLLLVETDRPVPLRLERGGADRALPGGTRHLLPVESAADGARILEAASGTLIQARALPPDGWRPVRWLPSQGERARFEVPGTALPALELTPEERGALWPDLPALPTPEAMLVELCEEVRDLELLVWIDEAHRMGHHGERLAEILTELGLHHRYESLERLLLTALGDVRSLPRERLDLLLVAHQLALIEAWLVHNGIPSPIRARSGGLVDRLLEVSFYASEERPAALASRIAFALNDDHFLPEMPDGIRSDTLTEVWFQKRNLVTLAAPGGTGEVRFEAFITHAEQFDREAFGLLELNGVGPLFFFESDGAAALESWRRDFHRGEGKPSLRRRYQVRVPDFLVEASNQLRVRFKLWTYTPRRLFGEVVMQAAGLARRGSAPGADQSPAPSRSE